jgi:hypothetical protein
MTSNPITMNNSDHARNTGEVGVQWWFRAGYGYSTPNQTVKVNNA